MRRHRRDLAPLTQINLTSLLDVAFVLLIAFMIVAPSLKYGIDLDLPSVNEGAPQLKQPRNQHFVIRIPRTQTDGAILMNDSPCDLAALEQRLSLQRASSKDVSVEIQADREVGFERFVQVIAAVRRAGIESVGLPVDVPAAQTPDPASKPRKP